MKTSIDLIRQLGYEIGVLSLSEFTDIVEKYESSAEEHLRYIATEWWDMFVSVGSTGEVVEQPDTIVDTGLVGE